MKKCTRCDVEKPLYQFNKNKRSIDGRYKVCIKCRYGYKQELQSETDKRCNTCTLIKSETEFFFINNKKHIRDSDCKECDKIKRSIRGGYIYDPSIHRVKRLKNRYGLTTDSYNQLVTNQNNKCKICNNITQLVVDHCHISGKIRGLLCNGCNTALGNFKDNIDFLNSAIGYLQESKSKV